MADRHAESLHIELLVVPFDTARRGWRMGAGPEWLMERGLESRLAAAGHRVDVSLIAPEPGQSLAEIATAFELMRVVARRVRAATSTGRFPLVLSGNCNIAVGTLAGLTPRKRTVFWFDAHGDCNTPDTTTSGF